jgi:hypothetical protein
MPTPDRGHSLFVSFAHVPWEAYRIDFIDKMQGHLARPGPVIHSLVSQSPDPPVRDLLRLSSLSLESFENGNRVFVGKRQAGLELHSTMNRIDLRRDGWLVATLNPRRVLVRRVARSRGIAGVLGKLT